MKVTLDWKGSELHDFDGHQKKKTDVFLSWEMIQMFL